MIDSKKLALKIALIAREKKALKINILDMRAVCNFCEFFVIMSGSSLRQVKAIAEAVQESLGKQGVKSVSSLQANDESGWVVLDYSSVIAHIFYKPKRDFYSLERLWSDAKKVRITQKALAEIK